MFDTASWILSFVLTDFKEVAKILISELLLEKCHSMLIVSSLWLIYFLF